MDNSEQQNQESSESEIAPITVQMPEQIVAKKHKLLTCSVFTGGSALLTAIILLGSYQLYQWHNHSQNENFFVLGKIQCNRATSSTQLYEVLKTAPRSSWPSVTTIGNREYVCISNYKVDVTDLDSH